MERLQQRNHRPWPLTRWLAYVETTSLAALIFGLPWILGGRHPWGRLYLVVGALIFTGAWSLRNIFLPATHWRKIPGWPLLLLGGILPLFQLLPMAPSLLEFLSPRLMNLLPLHFASPGSSPFFPWERLSLHPSATQAAWSIYISYVLFFAVVYQRLHSVGDVERMQRWIALSSLLMAIGGLFFYWFGGERFLTLYDHPLYSATGEVKASFANHNHFAHLLALGIGPWLWWMMNMCRGRTREQVRRTGANRQYLQGTPLWLFFVGGTLVIISAVWGSGSRGGLLVFGCASLIGVAGLLANPTTRRQGIYLLVALAFGGSFVMWSPRAPASPDAAADLLSGDVERLDRQGLRRQLWAAEMRAIHDFWRMGSGFGTHREVCPTYFAPPVDREFTHAESGYLQIFLEGGLPAFVLLITGVTLILQQCSRLLRTTFEGQHAGLAASIVASIAASLLHAAFDFVWYIPSLMVITLVQIACLFRLRELVSVSPSTSSVPLQPLGLQLRFAPLAVVLFLGTCMLRIQAPEALAALHWDRYLHATFSTDKSQQGTLGVGGRDAMATEWDHKAAQPDTTDVWAVQKEHLIRVLEANPYHARAHARLAATYLRLFEQRQSRSENPLPLREIAKTAHASASSDVHAWKKWLKNLTGPRIEYLQQASWHARRAVQLCPLQGEAYLYLRETAFLEHDNQNLQDSLLEQALHTRPHHGTILLEAGQTAWERGDFDRGLAFFQRAYATSPEHGARVRRLILGNEPSPSRLEFFIREFAPSSDVFGTLIADMADPPEFLWQALAHQAVREARKSDGRQAVEKWRLAHAAFREIGQDAWAIKAARSALALQPTDYRIRRQLAEYFAELGKIPEAREEITWCLRRQPTDQTLLRLWKQLETIDSETDVSRKTEPVSLAARDS